MPKRPAAAWANGNSDHGGKPSNRNLLDDKGERIMAKLVLAIFTSLDGYVARPNGEFVPPPWSAEVGEAWPTTT